MRWSSIKDVTYYDGVYLISSKKVGGILLTADDLLYDKAKENVKVMHLRDYGS